DYEAFGLTGLGMTCRDLGRLREAAGHLERAVRLGARLSRWNSSSAVQILGSVYWELGRFTDALDLLGPAVARDEEAGHRDGRAMMLDTVAKISLCLGRHEEGLEHAERALALVRDTKRYWIQASILNAVAAAHRKLAHPDQALQADEQALALARKVMSKRAETDTLLSLSITYHQVGRPQEARSRAAQALHLARAHSFRVAEGQALTALFETAPATDVELAQEALAIHRETGHRPGEARTLLALARAGHRTESTSPGLLSRQARDIFADIGMSEQEYQNSDH
ncbi:tetratricopeptide repeat protein, partial [Streptomyces flaveolus]|uniref:tetratricopeptide repeat protein n=1 Tax=Streptomyces flaveolus TaxID=67297 RepID=UPI0033DEF8D0